MGAAGIHFYLSDYSQRRLLWGPHAYYGYDIFMRERYANGLSLYSISQSTATFEWIFHLGLLVAVLLTIFGGRVLCALHWIFLVSIYSRNPTVLDGGDNVARICGFFLIFAVSNAYLAPGGRERRAAMGVYSAWGRASSALHNCAVPLIIFQTAVVYTVAGYWKATGPLWNGGTAMYYISHINAFRFLPLPSFLTDSPLILTGLTYSVIFAQLFFPVAILFRRTREWGVGTVASMHIGIALVMGLVGFALTMLAVDAVCLSDGDYRRSRESLGRLVRRMKGVASLGLADAASP